MTCDERDENVPTRSLLVVIAIALGATSVASCSRQAAPASPQSELPAQSSPQYLSLAEQALINLARRKFGEENSFRDEFIVEISGGSLVCGTMAYTSGAPERHYYFSTQEHFLFPAGETKAWRERCPVEAESSWVSAVLAR